LQSPPALLAIGSGGPDSEEHLSHIVSESPPATDINVYEKAYHEEVERIREAQGHDATIYLTHRVDSKDDKKEEGQSAWKRAMGKMGPHS
jgi:[calcium/calmodulin-dependent protein kinase] kinase